MLDRAETKALPTADAADAAARNALHEDSMKSSTQRLVSENKSSDKQGSDKKSSDTGSTPISFEPHSAPGRWPLDRASQWHKDNGWLVGSNFLPSNAINQLEMWQKETFDKKEIDRELSWAEGLGMNTERVFLHDLLWQQDPEGFKKRIDEFLTIADKHHIKPVFVLFDSCWDPKPHLGTQHAPVPRSPQFRVGSKSRQ